MARTKPYTVKEFAEITGKSKDTIYRWIRSGYIEAKKAKKYNENLIPPSELKKVGVELDSPDSEVQGLPDETIKRHLDDLFKTIEDWIRLCNHLEQKEGDIWQELIKDDGYVDDFVWAVIDPDNNLHIEYEI